MITQIGKLYKIQFLNEPVHNDHTYVCSCEVNYKVENAIQPCLFVYTDLHNNIVFISLFTGGKQQFDLVKNAWSYVEADENIMSDIQYNFSVFLTDYNNKHKLETNLQLLGWTTLYNE